MPVVAWIVSTRCPMHRRCSSTKTTHATSDMRVSEGVATSDPVELPLCPCGVFETIPSSEALAGMQEVCGTWTRNVCPMTGSGVVTEARRRDRGVPEPGRASSRAGGGDRSQVPSGGHEVTACPASRAREVLSTGTAVVRMAPCCVRAARCGQAPHESADGGPCARVVVGRR